MDLIRRNTDYALRAMVFLATHRDQGPASAKTIATEMDFSHQLACKLMQQLAKAGLVRSLMGKNGGFELARDPADITLLEMIEAIQGQVRMSACVLGIQSCKHFGQCPIRRKLRGLQDTVTDHLRQTTLQELTVAKKGRSFNTF